MTVEQAIDIIARHAMANVVHDDVVEMWDSYPDLGEDDWRAVVDLAIERAPYPDNADYLTAYELLSARAES